MHFFFFLRQMLDSRVARQAIKNKSTLEYFVDVTAPQGCVNVKHNKRCVRTYARSLCCFMNNRFDELH